MSTDAPPTAAQDLAERRSDSEKASIKAPKRRSMFNTVSIILTCFSAMLMNAVTLTSGSIALPDIGRDLHIPQDRLQWVPSAFALSSGCFLLLCGRLADLHGRKLTFLIGTAWMGVFALGCGFAKTEIQLYILRGLQGIGSAAAIPAALGVLAQSFPPGRRRSIGFATFSAAAPFGGGIGFNIGAVLTQLTAAGWRGTFYLTAGLTALSFIAGVFAFDADEPSTEPDRRVDWIGAALVTSGLILFTFVLGQGELASDGWRTGYIIALLIVGVFLVVAFLFWEDYLVKHSTRPPLMRLELWTRANGKFAAIQLIAFLEWCAFMSWILWVQLYYQTYKNYTPIKTMVRLIPATVTGLSLNFIVGIVVGWLPAIYLLVIGTTATGIACLLFAVIHVKTTYWAFAFPSTILAVWGADFIFSCGALFVARVALPHEQSLAGGVFQTVVQLGTSFGLAITTIVHNKVASRETKRLGVVPDQRGLNFSPEAQLKGYRAAQWTGFAFAMAALMIAVLLFRGVGVVGGKQAPPPPKEGEDVEDKGSSSSEGHGQDNSNEKQ